MTTTRTALTLTTLATLLLLAAPVHADDGQPDGSTARDDCPAVQITPWAPYVSFQPDCLPDLPDIPDIPQP
jgi:hypothetical protein